MSAVRTVALQKPIRPAGLQRYVWASAAVHIIFVAAAIAVRTARYDNINFHGSLRGVLSNVDDVDRYGLLCGRGTVTDGNLSQKTALSFVIRGGQKT